MLVNMMILMMMMVMMMMVVTRVRWSMVAVVAIFHTVSCPAATIVVAQLTTTL